VTTIKHSAKPTVVKEPDEIGKRLAALEAAASENKSLKATVARLEAELAVKATKPSKKARGESEFSAEDVLSMDQSSWAELAGEFYVRKTDGSFVPTITKTGGTRVTMKPGLDYGVYRFIKGIAVQMGRSSFEALSEKQVAALRNILSYCAAHDLVESPAEVAPVKKAGRPRKVAATV
jgi:hypothetical protein